MEALPPGVDELDEAECFVLLAGGSIGRVSVSVDALPVVLPVNYVLMGDSILMRTSTGTKLSAALDQAVVAFEVDDYDLFDHRGWSVLVQGRARVIDDPVELRMAMEQPLLPWGDPGSPFFVAVACERVTCRRVGPTPPFPMIRRHP